jgi:hypothetical protein
MWLEKQHAWEEEGLYCIRASSETLWYAAPTVTRPQSLNLHPLHLALTLHNAKLAKGRAPRHTEMIESVNASLGRPDDPLEPAGGGTEKKRTELFLESVRKEVNPTAPSRLACYFLSMDEETASRRMGEIRGQRSVYPCRVLNDGTAHFADITLFDDIYNAMDYPKAQTLAERYWNRSNSPDNIAKENLEILVGGSLYFPDWQNLPTLELHDVGVWESLRRLSLQEGMVLDQAWQAYIAAKAPAAVVGGLNDKNDQQS